MSLTRSHPKLKHRKNKYLENLDDIKTWVDMESSNTNDIEYSSTTDDLSTYYNRPVNTTSSIITTRQIELEGLYCKDTKYYTHRSIYSDENSSCHNTIWKCNKCFNCDNRRGLDIMIKIEGKFTDRPLIDKTHLQLIQIRNVAAQGLSTIKITKRMKYLGFTGLLLHTHDQVNDRISFLLDKQNDVDKLGYELTRQQSITYGGALQMVGNNKYRFLGEFYKKAFVSTVWGLTEGELKELKEQEHFKSDKCKCGDLWEDHRLKQRTKDEMINMVVPEDHFRIGHKKFLEQYFSSAEETQGKLSN